MTIQATWRDLLTDPLRKDHVVQLYRDDRVLVDAVSLFAIAGLGKGESVILVATLDHIEAVEERLRRAGLDTGELVRWGQLSVFNAAHLMEGFIVDGRPDDAAFREIAGTLATRARRASRTGRVRAYGEMVNLLWRTNLAAAARLEQLWNGVIEEHGLSLFCAYAVEPGERELPPLLRDPHSHLIPLEAGSGSLFIA